MQAIEILMTEHRLIERAITALTTYARAVAEGADLPRTDLAQLVSFLLDYADAYHHGKEEDILFRVMAAHGMPVNGGPLAVMLAEHKEGRRLTGSLAKMADDQGTWDQEQRRRLLFAATGYARLLKEHIQKEDRVLYPMAVQMLPEDAWRQIETEFSSFQTDPQNVEKASQSERIVNELGGRYTTDNDAQ